MRMNGESVQRDLRCLHLRRDIWGWIIPECRLTGEQAHHFIEQALLIELARRENSSLRARREN